MIKRPTFQEDRTIVNVYAPNHGASKYVRQKQLELKGGIDKSTILVGDFNTPFTAIDKATRQKINNDLEQLNNTINQQDLVDIYRKLHTIRVEYTFVSCTHGTVTKIDDNVGHKTNLDKF